MPKKLNSATHDKVAKTANISTAKVFYFANDELRPVAPQINAKVLAAIQKFGYKPNAVARNLRMQHTSAIGLIIPNISNPFFAEVECGVEQIAFEPNWKWDARVPHYYWM